MRKKKIVIQTNGIHLKTGLAEAGRALAFYLHKTGKYEVIYYATQCSVADPILNMMPFKTYGCIPADQQTVNMLNGNPGLARDVAYGSYYIDEIIKKEQPQAIIFSDDLWAWSLDSYANKKWHAKINPIYHITIDSVPVLDQAYQQAKKTKYYLTWAKFAAKEMKRFGPEYQHVGQIYGAVDTKDFSPISDEKKKELRKKFGISEKTIVVGMLGRNQLRKEYGSLLIAFAEYKKENPTADIKLHLHSSWSEKGHGWDFEKLMAYYGIKKEDVLCTYVCRNCGEWTVEPYRGEDIDCPKCGAQKSKITCNIQHGVPNEEMKYLHGIWDAGINLLTSGGQEFAHVNILMCGLPLACTNYSSGEDFCEQPFVTSINFERRFEAGTSFLKASNSIKSVKGYLDKIYRMSPEKRKEIGRQGYEWAKNTFSIDVIGKQWEKLLDEMPEVDWSDFSWEPEQKNPNFQLPANYRELSDDDFITLLYKEILKMDEPMDGSGRANWRHQLKNNISREQVFSFFIKTATEENNKNRKVDFWDLIDRHRPNKRAIWIVKESLGDCLMMTQLFESFHEIYPSTDLYIATDPKHNEIFEGNPFVHKVIPYQPFMEQEMLLTNAGQDKNNPYFHYFFHPCIGTQRILNYLTADKLAYNLNKE